MDKETQEAYDALYQQFLPIQHKYLHMKKKLEALKNGKSRGLGDTVEKVINKVTAGKVKSCGKCKKRRDALNRAFPYKGKDE